MRYELIVDDENPDLGPSTPWQASLFMVDENGKSRDMLCYGYGSTPEAAVGALTEEWKERSVVHSTQEVSPPMTYRGDWGGAGHGA